MRKKITAVCLSLAMLCAMSPICRADEAADNAAESIVVPTLSTVKTGYIPETLQAPPEIVGEAAIVVDMESGYTLYEKNIQTQHYPASITKIMTATLALENLNLQDVVTFSHDAVYTIEPGSSSAYADEGEMLTVEQCLYGLMLISGNDLANGLGEAVAGSMDAFAQMMTEKAAELGCVGTQFKNAHGLHDEGHYTTPYDMAIIAINAFQKHEMFRTLCSTVRYDVPPTNVMQETRYWLNNNRMLRPGEEYYYEACIGGKTGFTNEAGGTLVTYANICGRNLVCVIMKSTNSASAYQDSIALYDYISASATQEDFAFLDAMTQAEKESISKVIEEQKAQENTTIEKNENTVQVSTEPREKENGFAIWKLFAVLILIFLLLYFYVMYRRYQRKKRRMMRRRLRQQEEAVDTIKKRQDKYRNYDFKK